VQVPERPGTHSGVMGPVPQVWSTHVEVVMRVPPLLRVMMQTMPAGQVSPEDALGSSHAMAAHGPVVTRQVLVPVEQVATVRPAPAQSS
jgi:hypothetical protein